MNNYIHYLDLTEEVADTLKSNTPMVYHILTIWKQLLNF